MIRIETPTLNKAELISKLATQTFIESHGSSASKFDIDNYTSEHFNAKVFEKELRDEKNIYFLVYLNDEPVAYSKIKLNFRNPKVEEKEICKMDRLYVLQKFYDQGIGKKLFDHNIALAKKEGQKGMWLFVWTENKRALKFYEKQGFLNVGNTSFKISDTHSNPNYYMYLRF